jgi:hypothetical protein
MSVTLIRRKIEADEGDESNERSRGAGLSNETEVNTVYGLLGEASEILGLITSRVEGIAISDMGEDVPEVGRSRFGLPLGPAVRTCAQRSG